MLREDPNRRARLRVGVLGNGYWAWWCHGAILQADPDIEFVGFWGRNEDRSVEAARRVGGRAFTHLEQMLDAVDAVAIALPPDVQAEVAVQAARAGRHLLLDKPMSLDLDAANALVREVRSAGVRTLSFMTLLFQPEAVEWLSHMRSVAETSGPWESLTISMAGSIEAPGSPYATSAWRHQHGGLWDWGPHALSLVKELQSPVVRVSAIQGLRDTVNVTLGHENGSTSLLTLTVLAPLGAEHSSAEVWGPGGRHSIELPRENLREAYRRALVEFRNCVDSGSDHPLDVSYGRDVVAILDAARRNLDRPLISRTDVPRPITSKNAANTGENQGPPDS